METRKIMVSEIFITVQGEGALIGKPTVFVRTGGCDYACPPCDTLYAVLPQYKNQWRSMTTEEIFAAVQRLSADKPILVTLSGGNPAIQPLEGLLDMGHAHGYTFCMETQGSIAKVWFNKLDYLTLSPKGPTMIGTRKMNWQRLDHCISSATRGTEQRETQIYLKIVVFDDADYIYATHVAQRYPALPVYLQVGNHTPPHVSQEIDIAGIRRRMDWLMQKVAEDRWYDVTILPQLHTLLWGNKRGV
jgi:7-carboxy-7-deazaguanine synthase